MNFLLGGIAVAACLSSVMVGISAGGSGLAWIMSAILGLTATTAIVGMGIIGAIERGGKPTERRPDPNDLPDVRGL